MGPRREDGAAIPALIALGGNVLMLNLLAATGGWVIYVADPGDPRVQGLRDVLAPGSLGEMVVIVWQITRFQEAQTIRLREALMARA